MHPYIYYLSKDHILYDFPLIVCYLAWALADPPAARFSSPPADSVGFCSDGRFVRVVKSPKILMNNIFTAVIGRYSTSNASQPPSLDFTLTRC